jgi:hypothetical protein
VEDYRGHYKLSSSSTPATSSCHGARRPSIDAVNAAPMPPASPLMAITLNDYSWVSSVSGRGTKAKRTAATAPAHSTTHTPNGC